MMRMKCLIASLTIALALPMAAQASEYQFRYAHSQSADHPRSKSMEYFEKELEKRSDGRIDVELMFDGTLGSEEDVIQQVQMGLVQGTRGGMFAQANPAYQLFIMPFLFDSPKQALKVIESNVGSAINKGALKNGIYVPATGVAGGMRQLTNNSLPVKRIEDLQGLKIRTPPFPVTIDAFEAMGASPQQVPYTETYMALRTGVVDGQENPPSNIFDMRFYEAQKYLSLLNWQVNPDPFFISKSWYNSLPVDLQKVVTNVAKDTMDYSNKLWLDSEKDYLAKLQKEMQVNEISPEYRQEFVDAVIPVWKEFIKRGAFTQGQLNAVLEMTGKQEILENDAH